jgi:hypothetical protein
MKTDVPVSSLIRANYAVLFAGLAAGITAGLFNLRWALLPAAFIFGWSQIGGV